MTTPHEPRTEFIHRLEERVSEEVRRRQRAPAVRVPRWMPQSPLAAAMALAAVVVVSMTLGGAVVVARYEVQDSQQRAFIRTTYEQRLALARDKLSIARERLTNVQQRVARGIESQDALPEAESIVAEAQAQVRIVELQLAEAHASGREPQDTVSAPVVSGRDYVRERWQMQLTVPVAALKAEQARLSRDQQRFAVGAATNLDVAASRNRVVELQMAVRALERKIGVRQQFVSHEIDAPMAELRVLEVEAEQRRDMLTPKRELAIQQLQDLRTKVEVGLASALDLKEAELRLIELQVDIARAELDLSLVRKQIDQRKGKT